MWAFLITLLTGAPFVVLATPQMAVLFLVFFQDHRGGTLEKQHAHPDQCILGAPFVFHPRRKLWGAGEGERSVLRLSGSANRTVAIREGSPSRSPASALLPPFFGRVPVLK